jgi:hypothetical protein
MREVLLRLLSILCFDRYPYMYAGFCPHCPFYFQGIAWTRRGAYRRCLEIDEAHQEYHLHEHHPADELDG